MEDLQKRTKELIEKLKIEARQNYAIAEFCQEAA